MIFTNLQLELYVFFSTRGTLITFNWCVVHLNVYSDNQKVADFQVTAGTRFYSWIYTLQSRDLDTQKAFDTSGANDQLINLIFNGVKSPFEKIIYR